MMKAPTRITIETDDPQFIDLIRSMEFAAAQEGRWMVERWELETSRKFRIFTATMVYLEPLAEPLTSE
jgi:hypothetical protein